MDSRRCLRAELRKHFNADIGGSSGRTIIVREYSSMPCILGWQLSAQ